MKQLIALLATGAAIIGAAPSLAATITVPVTYNLATATITNSGGFTLSDALSIASQSISKGDTVDLQIGFTGSQAITLTGKLDLAAYLQAATGSVQAYSASTGTIKLLNGTTTVAAFSKNSSDGAENKIGQDYSVAGGDYPYSPASSVTFTGIDLTFTLGDFTDDDDLSVPGAYTRLYNDADFTVSAASGSVSGVPEPASWGMMVLGFGVLGAALRRKPVSARTA